MRLGTPTGSRRSRWSERPRRSGREKRPSEGRQAATRSSGPDVQSINQAAARRRRPGHAVGKAALRARGTIDHAAGVRVRVWQRMAGVPNFRRCGHCHLTLALALTVAVTVPRSTLGNTLTLQFVEFRRTSVQGAIGRIRQFETEAAQIASNTLEEGIALGGRLGEIRRHESAKVVLKSAHSKTSEHCIDALAQNTCGSSLTFTFSRKPAALSSNFASSPS